MSVTVNHRMLATPVRPTTTSLPLTTGVPAVPSPSVTAAWAPAIGRSKRKTTVADALWRGSTVGLAGTSDSGRSNVPEAPCTLRENAVSSVGGEPIWTGTAVPVPRRGSPTSTGPWLATLPISLSSPRRAPDAAGVNVTLMPQLAPGARLAGQLLVCAKSPEVVMLVNEITPESTVAATTMSCGALVVPTSWSAKTRPWQASHPGAPSAELSPEATSQASSAATLPVDCNWLAHTLDRPGASADGLGGSAIGPLSWFR